MDIEKVPPGPSSCAPWGIRSRGEELFQCPNLQQKDLVLLPLEYLLDTEKVPPLFLGPMGRSRGEELFQCPTFFTILGDNFYDQDGRLNSVMFDKFSMDVKSKFLMTTIGNHDFFGPQKIVPTILYGSNHRPVRAGAG